MKNKGYIFIGKPGVGKTTLIKKMFGNKEFFDVMAFVKKYEIEGIVPEEKTLDGYRDMYKDIAKKNLNPFILELGTNYPELNIKELKRLSTIYDIKIFLLDASKETCRKRTLLRKRHFDKIALERRLNRDFPKTYLDLLQNENLDCVVINMEGNEK